MVEKEYEIPVEGSLGLLALGHIGLQLWREKRNQFENLKISKFKNIVKEIDNTETNSLNSYFGKISE